MRMNYTPKMKRGDKFKVFGWIMAQGLEGGREYRIAYVYESGGLPAYAITAGRGHRVIVRHLCTTVDGWTDQRNNNFIEINRAAA